MSIIKKIEAMHKQYGITDGKKCGDCVNLIERQYGNKYFKCAVYGMSCSTSTDWAKKYQACGMFNVEVTPDKHRAISIRVPENEIMDGQIKIPLDSFERCDKPQEVEG